MSIASAIALFTSLLILAEPAQAENGDSRAVSPRALPSGATSWLDNKTLAYAGFDGVNWNLYTHSLSSATNKLLVSGEQFQPQQFFPENVSPDGRSLTFMQNDEYNFINTLRILDLRTRTPRDFAGAAAFSQTRDGDWSPDGKQLVFAGKETASTPWRIYTANIDGSNVRAVSHTLSSMPMAPAWSPDGERIVYSDFGSEPQGLRIVNADGTNDRWLAERAFSPAWSPDGTQLAVSRSHPQGGWSLELLRPADGSLISKVATNRQGQQPEWSPDGNFLAFSSDSRVWVYSFGPPIPPVVPPRPPSVSINDGKLYTNSTNVTLRVTAPEDATTVTVSNDGGFGRSTTFPVESRVKWKIRSSGSERLPKVVYVRFAGAAGVYSDDISLDQTRPSLKTVKVSKTNKSSRKLKLRATDKQSRVARVQANKRKSGSGARTLKYRKTVVVPKWKRTYIRVQDGAGNWSKWKAL